MGYAGVYFTVDEGIKRVFLKNYVGYLLPRSGNAAIESVTAAAT